MSTERGQDPIDAEHLATRLSETICSTPGAAGDAMGWLWPALLRELARGHPVTVDDLAHTTGRGAGEVRDGLAGLSDTEYDEHGAVVGHGITLRETPHQFTVAGQALYTWCALDTLIFPTVLGRPAQVVSPTPGSGELVALSVDPDSGVTALQLIETQSYLQGDTAGPQSVIPPQGIEQAWCR
ncbi:organomercurial lyase [Pseudonocardia alni]|uniref:organomercurial lyase n=1 Tax=Pseudonocardia alni TaxID=33907 RepID=UPI0033EF79C0